MNIINFRFELSNPFDRWEFFKSLGCIAGKFTKYKAWELEHSFYTGLVADFELDWKCRTDHAGFGFSVGLLGYGIAFRIYDTRHWNNETKTWEQYDYSRYEVDYYA
jgi:hypothetical protein